MEFRKGLNTQVPESKKGVNAHATASIEGVNTCATVSRKGANAHSMKSIEGVSAYSNQSGTLIGATCVAQASVTVSRDPALGSDGGSGPWGLLRKCSGRLAGA